MTRPVTFWYTKHQPIFENNEEIPGSKIDVTRLPAGADHPPSLKISHTTYELEEKADWEYLRLSLPVTCDDRFISDHERQRRYHEIQMRLSGHSRHRHRGGGVGGKQSAPPAKPEAPVNDPAAAPASTQLDSEVLNLMNEYFYGVRIFPGQDPSSVYLGWVTTQYHLHSADFSHDQVRVATVQKLDSYGGVQESVDRLSCYMVRADELYGEVSTKHHEVK